MVKFYGWREDGTALTPACGAHCHVQPGKTIVHCDCLECHDRYGEAQGYYSKHDDDVAGKVGYPCRKSS